MPLRRELEYLQLYLSNEEVRFQDRLKVEITADPVLLDAAVPQMAQQPIVENAIRPLKSAHHSRFGAPARCSISPKVLAGPGLLRPRPFQIRFELARPPPHVRLPLPQHRFFQSTRRLVRMPMRCPTPVFQPALARPLIAMPDRVARRSRDPVRPAQLRHRLFASLILPEELPALFHHSAHFPRHALFYMPPLSGPNCKRSPRSIL